MSRSTPSGDLAHEELRAPVSSPGGGSVDFGDGRHALRITRDSAYRGDVPIGVVNPHLAFLYELLGFLSGSDRPDAGGDVCRAGEGRDGGGGGEW